MHRIPRMFTRSDKTNRMDSKQSQSQSQSQNQNKPKLERRYAKKNINYEPSTSFSSQESPTLRTRSLDILPFCDRTSFRIEGAEGEIDIICRTLGLSGPEDFAIPLEAWEARKARSSSDLLPRSKLNRLESPKVELEDRFAGSVRVSDAAEEKIQAVELNASELLDPSSGSSLKWNRSNEVRGGGRGINGIRPPHLSEVRPCVLVPPPSMAVPVVDDAISTWDIMRSFAPDDDRGGSSFVIPGGYSSSDDNEEEEEEDDDDEDGNDGEIVEREQVRGLRLGETAALSESCSFTSTSNDDDSSSTTTEHISPNGRFIRSIAYWQKGDLLGRGSFGSVYEGIADGGFFFAVKEVSLLDQGELGRQSICQLEQEIALLSQFEHDNILQYYGTDKDESKLYIFLELVTKGSLLSLYQRYHLQDSQASAYTRQILLGLKYLHDRNVVHRDIKCANILVDASGSIKLADFGLAKATRLNDVQSCKGTAFWMAPEVVNRKNQGYGLPADIWSLGCTVLEMLTRQLPYAPLECMQALFKIGRSIPPPVPESLSRDARDFISLCLQVVPNARPTAAQLLQHPFVNRPLPSASASPCHPGRRP